MKKPTENTVGLLLIILGIVVIIGGFVILVRSSG